MAKRGIWLWAESADGSSFKDFDRIYLDPRGDIDFLKPFCAAYPKKEVFACIACFEKKEPTDIERRKEIFKMVKQACELPVKGICLDFIRFVKQPRFHPSKTLADFVEIIGIYCRAKKKELVTTLIWPPFYGQDWKAFGKYSTLMPMMYSKLNRLPSFTLLFQYWFYKILSGNAKISPIIQGWETTREGLQHEEKIMKKIECDWTIFRHKTVMELPSRYNGLL